MNDLHWQRELLLKALQKLCYNEKNLYYVFTTFEGFNMP